MVRARPLVRTEILVSAVTALSMAVVSPAQAHAGNIYHGNDMAYRNAPHSWVYACPGGCAQNIINNDYV